PRTIRKSRLRESCSKCSSRSIRIFSRARVHARRAITAPQSRPLYNDLSLSLAIGAAHLTVSENVSTARFANGGLKLLLAAVVVCPPHGIFYRPHIRVVLVVIGNHIEE